MERSPPRSRAAARGMPHRRGATRRRHPGRRRLPVQDHQHRDRRHAPALPRLLREAPQAGRTARLQRRLAGLRHGRADHRPDARREDRHRLDGRLPAAHQRVPAQADDERPHRAGLGHRLQPARRRSTWSSSPPDSEAAHPRATSKGEKVSASVGSAGHGTLVQRAATRPASTPTRTSRCVNQQPTRRRVRARVRAARRRCRSSSPGRACSSSRTRPSCCTTAAALDLPTFHGVVVRDDVRRGAARGASTPSCRRRSTRPNTCTSTRSRRPRSVADADRPARPRSSTSTTAATACPRSTRRIKESRSTALDQRRAVPEVDRGHRPTRSTSTRSSTTRLHRKARWRAVLRRGGRVHGEPGRHHRARRGLRREGRATRDRR